MGALPCPTTTLVAALLFVGANLVNASPVAGSPSSPPKPLGDGWTEKRKEDGKVVQELKIEAPAMTEEDQYGYVMPDRYRCDSCKAIVFHLDQVFRKKQLKNRRLKQWEYTDAFDEICSTNTFQGYGIKLVKGENALSGPGLPADEGLAPGSGSIQMSSENWSKRLAELCRKLVYEQIGEDDVYERVYNQISAQGHSDDNLTDALCVRETPACVTRPTPAQPKASDSKTGKAKKNKKQPQTSRTSKPVPTQDKGAFADKAVDVNEHTIDIQTYMRRLAVRHGFTSDEYLAARTTADWDKLTVAVAGRIFNQFAEHGLEESCKAK